jgi:hypothetical protein
MKDFDTKEYRERRTSIIDIFPETLDATITVTLE